MRFVLLLYFCLFSINTFAADAFTRNYTLQATMTSYATQVTPMGFWLSSYVSEKKPTYFSNASGGSIIANPSFVVSGYDSTSTRYDMSSFYALQRDRIKLIGHINGLSRGELFSIGFDSGISTQKLIVSNAIYLGYAKTFSFTKSTISSMSFGSWIGGGISERPCMDDYGRKYSCQSLTAWTDYRPSYPKPLSFIDFRHVWFFD